ncbi:hypothetical protein QBL02_09540, partial [Leucobacter sp. UT-8R-CII-1-4]|nr:hypothetical protein [Leucobacter sp. UT-8R-CII-1-4]
MEAFGKRMRGGLATLLSAALVVSGALLAAPAASAEEPAAETSQVVEPPVAEAPAEETTEASETAEPSEATEAPAEETAVEEAPASEEAPAEAPQAAAVSTPVVVTTEAARAGGTITVTGSGFNPAAPGVYVGFGPAGLPGFYIGSGSMLDTVFVGPTNEDGSTEAGRTAKLNADGTFTTTFTAPAFEDAKSYAVYTSKAHGQGMGDKSQDTTTAVAYSAPVVAAPAVTVEGAVSDLDPDAANVVTVRGTGFVASDPETSGSRPPLAGKFTGTYVVFGSFAEVWQ